MKLRLPFIIVLLTALVFFVYTKFFNPCNSAEDCNLVCYEALHEQNFARAWKFCTLSIKKDSKFTWPLSNRSTARLGLHDYLGAIEDTTKAIELDPNYTNAYNNRGNAKRELGDYAGAEDDFKQAMLLDKTKHDAFQNIAILYQSWRKFDKMKTASENFISAFPANPDGYRLLAAAQSSLGERKAALGSYKKAFEKSNDKSDLYNAARIDVSFGNYGKACDYLKANGGDCSYIVYKMKEETAACEDSLKRKPSDISTLERLLQVKKYLGDKNGELEIYNKLLDVTDSYRYYNERAWELAMLARYKEAMPDAEKAIAKAPKDEVIGYIYDTRAVIKYGLGDYEAALKDHNEAVRQEPYSELYRNRAITRAALKNFNGAQEDLQKAWQLQKEGK